MEFRKITSNEVTVYISDKELVSYDIVPGKKIRESATLHRFLFRLMDTVYNITGFDPYDGQVVVEATPSMDGMSFTISKLSRKLTKDEFKRVKKIRVKSDDFKDLSDLSRDDFISMLESIEEKKNQHKKSGKGVFIFADFRELEIALCSIPYEMFRDCSLYRNGNRYAIIAEYAAGTKFYNLISEYATGIDDSSVIADDISEGWKLVAKKLDLVEMVCALREMM